ncbi:Na+/H+ antiporter subunit E [Paenibacillus sp. IB182496]|uniref:Na+/H+ antiporter subunit E n=1 Tax=Paenibacillus sabuli TaxID=2772509 RepID=A0A927BRU1_9BACL|nr:Na+/H+ antiporter subunit E [Paenibacillus sabuli]MBD2844580.1 Na+/H+ antiporter subunit E [Paenibacillus sabuli]
MGLQIVLNLIIAVVWMFLNNEWTAVQLIVGYALGALIMLALRRFFNHDFYLRRVWAFLLLLVLFLRELIMSNISVIRELLRPKLAIRPGIFAYDTELRGDWEITALACLITLTPGTLTLEVSPDQRTLYIHAMDIADAEELSAQIRSTFEKAIKEVTR